MAFGDDVHAVYHFDEAARILSLDCNFLEDEPGSVRYAREFVDNRRVQDGRPRADANRLYVVESTVTITGANADHRLALPPGRPVRGSSRTERTRLCGASTISVEFSRSARYIFSICSPNPWSYTAMSSS